MGKRPKTTAKPTHSVLPGATNTPVGVKVLPRRSAFVEALQRLAVAAVCMGAGYGLWGVGRTIIRTGVYAYVLESSDGVEERSSRRESRITRERVHATGSWAKEQAVGFMVVGVTLAYWGILVLLGSLGPFTNPLVWNPLLTAMMAGSLGCCLTAVVAFFPPWRIGASMSCNAFYIVATACIYLATIRDRNRLKEQSSKVFPALIVSAVLVGNFSSGYAVGIILGIFVCLLLAVHILMLLSKARAELMRPNSVPNGVVVTP